MKTYVRNRESEEVRAYRDAGGGRVVYFRAWLNGRELFPIFLDPDLARGYLDDIAHGDRLPEYTK